MPNSKPTAILFLPQGPVLSGITMWEVRLANKLVSLGRAAAIVRHRSRTDLACLEFEVDARVQMINVDVAALPDEQVCLEAVTDAYRRTLASLEGPAVLWPNLHHLCYAAVVQLQAEDSDRFRVAAQCHCDCIYDHHLIQHYAPGLAAVAASSLHLRDLLNEENPELNERLVHTPCPVPAATALAERQALSNRPIRLLYAGRLDEMFKRTLLLIKLAHQLTARGVEFEMRLVGDGPAATEVDRAIHSMPQVEHIHTLPYADLLNQYDWADVYVSTSQTEGLSVSMVEAMGRGCVPVVSRVNGVEQAVRHGQTGYVYEFGDIETMATLIESLDEETITRRRSMAWEYARVHHDPAHHARIVAKLMDGLMNAPALAWPSDRPLEMPASGAGDAEQIHQARQRLAELIDSLADRRIALWGAGRHTQALADIVEHVPEIVCVIDDDPVRQGEQFFGRPIVSPRDVQMLEVTDVIISSAMHEADLFARRDEVSPCVVHRLYGES